VSKNIFISFWRIDIWRREKIFAKYIAESENIFISFWRIDIWRREKIFYLSMVRDIPVSEGVQTMASQFLCSKND